jgi:hypothetical protein
MAGPLTKKKKNGQLYVRPPHIAKAIAEAETQDLVTCVWQEHLAHFGGLIWPTLSC